MIVKQVVFEQMAPCQGEQCALLHVQLEQESVTYKVYVERLLNGGYQIRQVLKDDSDYSIDWYDNDMHHAIQDVTEGFTARKEDAGMLAENPGNDQGIQPPNDKWPSRPELLEEILSYPGIREQLDEQSFNG